VRLIDAGRSSSEGESTPIPPAFTRRDGEWLVIARYPIFGAEELSSRAPAMATRLSAARVSLHPEDATRLGVTEHDFVELEHEGCRERLAVEIAPALVRGMAAVTAGLPGLAWMPLPAWMTIHRARTEEPRR
jgi:NADH-quinone oxidoreductase subunit G